MHVRTTLAILAAVAALSTGATAQSTPPASTPTSKTPSPATIAPPRRAPPSSMRICAPECFGKDVPTSDYVAKQKAMSPMQHAELGACIMACTARHASNDDPRKAVLYMLAGRMYQSAVNLGSKMPRPDAGTAPLPIAASPTAKSATPSTPSAERAH